MAKKVAFINRWLLYCASKLGVLRGEEVGRGEGMHFVHFEFVHQCSVYINLGLLLVT